MANLITIGRAETIDLPGTGITKLPAKVDTGAYRSSIWASNVHKKGATLYFTLLGPGAKEYTGQQLQTTEFKTVQVENSFGDSQKRYSIFLSVEFAGKAIRSNFTLANRANKTYPVLIGRKMLKNRFLVDVSKGTPLADEELNGDDSLE